MSRTFCTDLVPVFLDTFTAEGVPILLFYSYVPIVIIAVILSCFVFIKSKNKLLSGSLLSFCVVFSLWIIAALIQWTAVEISTNMWAWQVVGLFEIIMYLMAVHFFIVFVRRRSLHFSLYLVGLLLALPVIILIPTKSSVVFFDVYNCEAHYNFFFTSYIYAVEILCILFVTFFGIKEYLSLKKDTSFRKQISLITIATISLLSIFTLTSIWGEATYFFSVNLIGPFGMVAFLVLMTYMIVKYNTFHIKLVATQALVVGTAVLIGARLFYSTTTTGFILSAATLIFFLVSGVFLVRSVKREIEQRERIENLAKELGEANEHQASLIHFIAHQVKSFLTKSRYIFGELDEGTYGELKPEVKAVVKQGLAFNTDGVNMVQNVLHAANIKTGKVIYEKKPLDFKAVVEKVIETQRKSAEDRGLALSAHLEAGDYTLEGDADQLSHAVQNLIDNAIKYTPRGEITVALRKNDSMFRLSIKDSGIGISEKDKEHIFTEGGRGENSQKVNADSTGYGLYIVKGIVEAHGGKVWYESEGEGKGTTFFVEVPGVQSNS
jgi:signal transduction histidine kinase